MTVCPRCGTGLLPTASICTACCHLLGDNTPEPIPARADISPPEAVPAPEETADSGVWERREALMHWPFGGADAETVEAVAQATSVESRSQLTEAAGLASGQHAADLGIPTQRAAAFNPLTVSTAPPPNPYLAAERKQQAGFRAAVSADAAS